MVLLLIWEEEQDQDLRLEYILQELMFQLKPLVKEVLIKGSYFPDSYGFILIQVIVETIQLLNYRH